MRIGMIGAGVMGLTMAHRLGLAGHKVTLLEAAPQVGGLATWSYYGDFVWDKFYHVICRADEHLLGLIDELDLTPSLRWNRTRTGFLWDGRHLSMSTNWEFLTFPALSLLDKGRLAAGILYVQRINDPAPLERISAAAWLRRIFGKRVYDVIWNPLLESKYGVLKDEMPATIMWATIKRYYSTRDKSNGHEMLGFLTGGYKTFFDALCRRITEAGGEILCRQAVASIEEVASTDHSGPVVVRTADHSFEFDQLISTLPTELLNTIGTTVQWTEPALSARPRFLGVICLALVLRRPLNPFYVTNLIQKGFPFTGIIGVSNLTGAAELNGRHLVILPRYDIPDSPWFGRSLDELAGEFLEALRPIWPDIHQNVVRCIMNRERMVQALWIDSPPPPQQGPRKSASGKIWSVNAELTGRDTLNNNAIVRVANRVSEDLLKELREARPGAVTPAG